MGASHSTTLQGKKILLIVGGGIAAYKVLELVRRLRERGASVRGVLTPAARHFVTPLSLASLTGNKVHEDLFSLTDEAEMGHIELSRWADLVVVAPATADLMAKNAGGLANDLASTLLLATDKKVLMAPAMNVRMWHHPATARNVEQLRQDGISFVGPAEGEMACGEYGLGRMSEPLEIVARIEDLLRGKTRIDLPAEAATEKGILAGLRVVVTSGPTHEPIDPVRYIANRSSGKQGHAIAQAAAQAGATVVLVSGPVNIAPPSGVEIVCVETAEEMLAAVRAVMPADIFVSAAAVADWRVENAGSDKIKKQSSVAPALKLIENPDILATVGKLMQARPRLVVGFAAETSQVLDHARSKLARKGCDLIVANDVSEGTGVMGGDRNAVHLLSSSGVETWPSMSKVEVARRLVHVFASMLKPTP